MRILCAPSANRPSRPPCEGGEIDPMAYKTADILEYDLLKQNARNNRKNMTEAESVFWSLARAKSLGDKCLRQHVIGNYIVDFLFRKSMLVIELDGEYHFTEEQQREDVIRQDWLEHNGYRVLRFTNEQVLFDTEQTLEIVKKYINI